MRLMCPIVNCGKRVPKNHIVPHPTEPGALLARCPAGHNIKLVPKRDNPDFYTGPIVVKGKGEK